MNPLPSELLKLAKRLLGRATNTPGQASLRRAISTAYYALFHLLTLEAGGVFFERHDAVELIVRAYDHRKMAKTSSCFARGELPQKLNPLKKELFDLAGESAHAELKQVATIFVEL